MKTGDELLRIGLGGGADIPWQALLAARGAALGVQRHQDDSEAVFGGGNAQRSPAALLCPCCLTKWMPPSHGVAQPGSVPPHPASARRFVLMCGQR